MFTIPTAEDRQAQPWKNGGGITRPVMNVPCGKLEFGWRLSLLALAPLTLNGHGLGPLDAALVPAGVGFDAQRGSFWQARLTPLADRP
jgi:hypothetical protein